MNNRASSLPTVCFSLEIRFASVRVRGNQEGRVLHKSSLPAQDVSKSKDRRSAGEQNGKQLRCSKF